MKDANPIVYKYYKIWKKAEFKQLKNTYCSECGLILTKINNTAMHSFRSHIGKVSICYICFESLVKSFGSVPKPANYEELKEELFLHKLNKENNR